VQSVMQVLNHPQLNHKMEVRAASWQAVAPSCCERSLKIVGSRWSLAVCLACHSERKRGILV